MKVYQRRLRNRKRRIDRRLDPERRWGAQPEAMTRGGNLHYEMAERTRGMSCGGIGAFVELARRTGLVKEIDDRLHLLKVHLPYHESDHVLNLAFNALLGGMRLEDIELRRNDEVYLDGLGAQRIPDPTTAGDFTRRFDEGSILTLMESVNRVRERLWAQQDKDFLAEAIVDLDGTLTETFGECKEGMDISYKGIWGYAPLLISLANTREPLYLVNRPGNAVSHQGAAEWIDRAIQLVRPHAQRVCLRGDTDFSLTANFDRWSEQVDFVFGMDASPTLKARASTLPEAAWKPLKRRAKYTVKTKPRNRPDNVKERIVKEREFKNLRLDSEHVAEFTYQPGKCQRAYRVVVVRKNLSVEKGERVLFEDVRYFFYLTTRTDLAAAALVQYANQRCDQENVIEQLKNGVNAMRMPVDNLQSNWAYMVMTSLAWTLKSWFALCMRTRADRDEVLGMEFRRFLHTFVLIPCQLVRTGRKLVYRLLGYNRYLTKFFSTFLRIKSLRIRPGPALAA